ncbi:hypothetical protein [Pseudomonas sp. CLCA07]
MASFKTAQLQHELELVGQTDLDLSKVRFEAINVQALKAWELWQDPHFAWNEVVGWKASEPLALDLAIWFDEELCGLCFANPNNSRQRIRIVRLEGRPGEDHPLKKRIASLAILVVEQYAKIIGSRFHRSSGAVERCNFHLPTIRLLLRCRTSTCQSRREPSILKTVQYMTNDGGKMGKPIKKSPTRKRSSTPERKQVAVELTASERRILQLIATGIEGEEPSLLAGRPYIGQ